MARPKPQPDDLPVADYARYSVNPNGTVDSCANQHSHSFEWIGELWPKRAILSFEDDNISASDPTIERPGFNDLLASIRAGKVGAVVATMQSRLVRNGEEFAILRRACLAAGIEVWHMSTTRSITDIQLATALGPAIEVTVDQHYSEVTKVNVRRAKRTLALQGVSGGGICFGYVRGEQPAKGGRPLIPDPAVAGVAQAVFEAVLRGMPMSAIADDLNQRGIPTPRQGKQWRPSNIRRMLRAPTLTGLSVHHGEVVGEGQWEPIVDRETWDAVQRLLGQPGAVMKSNGVAAPRGNPRATPRKYLLSGIARCERCGTTLSGTKRKKYPAIYTCHSSRGGCDRLHAKAAETDEEATRQLLEQLDSEEYRQGLARGDVHADTRAELTESLAEIKHKRELDAEDEDAGRMSRETWLAHGAKLDKHEEAIRRQLREIPPPVGEIDPDAILKGWELATLEERRAIFALTVDHVMIAESTRVLRGGFDVSRVRVVMREL